MNLLTLLAIIFYFGISALYGITELIDVENHAASGNSIKAISLLEIKQKQKLEIWQQDRIEYNIGTILLNDGKAEEALEHLRAVALTSDTFLVPWVRINTAIALWKVVQSSFPIQKYSTYIQAIDQLKSALIYLQSVSKEEYPQTTDLKETIKSTLVALMIQKQKIILHYATLNEKVFELTLGLERILKQIETNSFKGMDSSEKEKMLQVFSKRFYSWKPLWENVLRDDDLFSQSYSLYVLGIEEFLKDNMETSKNFFKESKELLMKQLKQLYHSEKSIELLLTLQNLYQSILEQDIAFIGTLEKMLAEQTILESIYPEIKQSTLYLSQAITNIQEQKVLKGKIFLKAAYETLRWNLRKQEKIDPKVMLQNLIQDQREVIELNSKSHGLNDESVTRLFESLQRYVNQEANSFLPMVYEYQQKLYRGSLSDNNIWCQCDPWREVLPLFNQGHELAIMALDQLKGKKMGKTLAFQKKSLQYWEKALEAFNQGSASKSAKEENADIKESLRLLQQMEVDDRVPKKEVEVIGGNKPW